MNVVVDSRLGYNQSDYYRKSKLDPIFRKWKMTSWRLDDQVHFQEKILIHDNMMGHNFGCSDFEEEVPSNVLLMTAVLDTFVAVVPWNVLLMTAVLEHAFVAVMMQVLQVPRKSELSCSNKAHHEQACVPSMLQIHPHNNYT